MVFYTGVYTSGRSTQDGSETLTALTLLPNGEAQMTLSTPDNPFILQTGTWTVGPNPDRAPKSITDNLTQQGDQTIDETFVFQVQRNLLRGTEYDSNKWGTDLTFTKVPTPFRTFDAGQHYTDSRRNTERRSDNRRVGNDAHGRSDNGCDRGDAHSRSDDGCDANRRGDRRNVGNDEADFGGVSFSFGTDPRNRRRVIQLPQCRSPRRPAWRRFAADPVSFLTAISPRISLIPACRRCWSIKQKIG